MAYPSTIGSISDPQASDRLNGPSHSGIERDQNTNIEEIQTFIGLTNGATASAVGTLLYDIRAPGSNGGGHIQAVNKGGTGQTSYTKGDILIASSSSVLTKLAIGNDDQVLVADSSVFTGVKWGAVPAKTVQSFAAGNHVWTKPSAIAASSRIFVELWGGGGGGATSDGANEAGGGGGGGYVNAWFTPSMLTTSVLVAVGAGGASQSTPAGGGGVGQDGNAGNITVFAAESSILTAYAGGAGGNDAGGGGGGGGAGIAGSGNSSTDSLGGAGGFYFSTQAISRYNTGGNTNVAGSVATYIGSASGGGGGGGDGAAGGAARFGGGGGGGARSNAFGAGGASFGGGPGSAGSILTNGSVTAGTFPAGGGGASYGGGSASGKGGDGFAIVTTFY